MFFTCQINIFFLLSKEGEEGPDIRGGPVDALVVHACSSVKSTQFHKEERTYQEAFLTTYRTFVTPEALIDKLLCRYHKYICYTDR